MAQPQPQLPQQMAGPAYSPPPQHSPSPSGTPTPSTAFAMPPNKRPRTDSPANSQPTTPYPQSPYAMSPVAPTPPPMPASPAPVSSLPMPSPAPIVSTPQPQLPQQQPQQPQHLQQPQQVYTNGVTATPTMMMAATPMTPTPTTTASNLNLPMLTPPLATPQMGLATPQNYTNATMVPIAHQPLTPGVMGPPPARPAPAERPVREYEYDVSDSLAGTGIDLRVEEQYLADYYAGNFAPDARTGLPANAPGNKGSFYGSGFANQPAQHTRAKTHEELVAETAETAWTESAQRLAATRQNEIKNPFLMIPILHRKLEKVAREHNVELNVDLKNPGQLLGRMKMPQDFHPQPKVTVMTRVGPDGAMVSTTGSWIPHDAFIVDQLALLSIATKHHLKEKLHDSYKLSVERQASSHGDVPAEWADAGAPLNVALTSSQGDLGATETGTQSLKRSFSSSAAGSQGPSGKAMSLGSIMREVGKADRSVEEERLRKRQKRLNPSQPAPPSRSGSLAPGTPGSVAPEPEKAPTKSQKKSAAASRLAEASSTASANQTLATLMGGFGGRKKGKSYSWMTPGGGSGASTPKMSTAPGGGSGPAPKGPEKTNMTQEGRYRLGQWREDSEKGKGIQLRDWVATLEHEGVEVRAIQEAYTRLDESAK